MNNPVADKQKNNKLILFTCTSFCTDVVLSGCSAEFAEHPSILVQQPQIFLLLVGVIIWPCYLRWRRCCRRYRSNFTYQIV